ncbi:TATA-box-binding protein [Natronococcus sp. A-GB7]|uniref:TATA-box-binding protein n=1 Tax=Natronococcus sp. A-GB7 TaxID=3037649 RepID=UPI00241D8C5F|nr:TATA-box-binding protein [Natronococcus sp. A-GB7]MDG5821226.1 TATA-box-binding protein [Natronococcus sp. A-GB7]
MTVSQEFIRIENVVASSSSRQELDFESVAVVLTGADYDPEKFPGLIYRSTDFRSTALMFCSGKVVCTGAKGIEDVHESMEMLFNTFRDLQIEVAEDPEIIVQNIVSSADLGRNLNLNAIVVGFGLKEIEYKPEQFPGLVYRLNEPDVAALLFSSGKLVVTGGKDTNDAEQALDVITKRLEDLGLLE